MLDGEEEEEEENPLSLLLKKVVEPSRGYSERSEESIFNKGESKWLM